jgi:choline dehydrogenase-like flavoprotein
LRLTSVTLRNFLEMAPSPSNRIVLSDTPDPLGIPRARVIHQCGHLDRKSAAGLHRQLHSELIANHWGKLSSNLSEDSSPWPLNLDASHHIGGTRIGLSTASSVVNPDCRLHDSPNLFIAGSSVFPTAGNANPTFTIVALAIRLARHIARSQPSPHPS